MTNEAVSSLEVAKEALLKDARDREMECGKQITELLDQFRCALIPSVIVSPDGRILAKIDIKAV